MNVTVNGNRIVAHAGETLFAALTRAGLFSGGLCGGAGRCGRCQVTVTAGDAPVTAADRAHLSAEEIAAGRRLACALTLTDDLSVMLPTQKPFTVQGLAATAAPPANGDLGTAVDIGTTTLAFALVDLQTGAVVGTASLLNSQRAYGADVLSRVHACERGEQPRLTEMVRGDVLRGLRTLCERAGVGTERLKAVTVVGNTAMCQLFTGFDCAPLAQFPFEPYDAAPFTADAATLFGAPGLTASVTVPPPAGPFFGADALAGLAVCGFSERDGVGVFLDLGTNAELAVGGRDGIFAASAAAGPAFEGGALSCGCGSIEGAVCDVTLGGDAPKIVTVGNAEPVGLCGSGVVALLAELLRTGAMDASGLLQPPYFDEGFPVTPSLRLLQGDVRAVQLAKGAVSAGLRVLMKRAGVTCDDVDRVWLAGGFGAALSPEKAAAVGLLPPELAAKATAVGNTALAGAVRALLGGAANLPPITTVDLNADEEFPILFFNSMEF